MRVDFKGDEIKRAERGLGGVNKYIPIITSFLLFSFGVFPFFFSFSVSRLRFENISFVSELLKKDIFENMGDLIKEKKMDLDSKNLDSKKLNPRFILKSIYEICQLSVWTKKCEVDFLLPGLAVINFVEIEPIGFLLDGDKVFLISTDAQKVSSIPISHIYELGLNKLSLPFIKIESGRCSLDEIVSLISYMRSLGANYIDQVVCFDFSFELFTDEGYRVILPKDDVQVAFAKFVRLKEGMEGVSEIDVRGVEKIFVK